jgi:hypothetical protein
MTKIAKKIRTSLDQITKGMSSPAEVYQIKQYRYPHNSERDAMRSDWERVGGDFKVAIDRENGKTTTG